MKSVVARPCTSKKREREREREEEERKKRTNQINMYTTYSY
jgi:hypothetical protein